MEFVWDESSADIGHYECALMDGGQKIETISFWDYTNEWQHENAQKSHYERAYSFEVSYCCGYSMRHGFDYDKEYRRRRDEDGKRLYGYNGASTHTVEDVKRWCEEYLAEKYIDGYANMLASLNTAKRRAEWFTKNGYGSSSLGK